MPSPVTIDVTVDASGAIRGSEQAASAVSGAFNKISTSTGQLTQATEKGGRALEVFSHTPTRGVSAVFALESAISQATGGFRALGPAAAGAEVALRGGLFAISNLIGPVGVITLAITGLAAVFALTSANAAKLSDSLKTDTGELRLFLAEGGKFGNFAGDILRKKIFDLEIELKRLNTDLVVLQSGLTINAFGVFNFQLGNTANKVLDLKDKILAVTKALDNLGQPRHATLVFDFMAEAAQKAIDKQKELAAITERLFDLQARGIASEKTQSISIAEHNQALLQSIGLERQIVEQKIRQATNSGQLAELELQMNFLIRQEQGLRLQTAFDTVNSENIKKKAVLDTMSVENQVEQQSEKIKNKQKQKNREIEQTYLKIGSAIERGINASLFTTASLTQRIKSILSSILDDLAKVAIHQGLKSLFPKLFGTAISFIPGGQIPGGVIMATGRVGAATPPPLALSTGSGNSTNIVFNVNALDAANFEQAVRRIIPPLERAIIQRESRIALR